MIGKQSLDDLALNHLPPLADYEIGANLLESIPSMRRTVCESASFELKDWLLGVRNIQRLVGELSLNHTNERQIKWRTKKLSDPIYNRSTINSPLELVLNDDDDEFDPIFNEKVNIDLKPLLHCIHIYDALSSRSDLRKAYQEDRKSQADLILSQRSSFNQSNFIQSLKNLLQDVVGFFIIEKNVLKSTSGFRSESNVDDLWDNMCLRISDVVRQGLSNAQNTQSHVTVKQEVMCFIWTLESYEFNVQQLNSLLIALFEEYNILLNQRFKQEFLKVFENSDQQSMSVGSLNELEEISKICWINYDTINDIYNQDPPIHLPFSNIYPSSCKLLRSFIDEFYKFTDGFTKTQFSTDTDNIIANSLDKLISESIVGSLNELSQSTYNLSQATQIVVDITHFELAVYEFGNLISALNGTVYDQSANHSQLNCIKDVNELTTSTMSRINNIIGNKLDSFFEMADVEWTPDFSTSLKSQINPSEYLKEMMDYLTFISSSVLNNLPLHLKSQLYTNAIEHISVGIMVCVNCLHELCKIEVLCRDYLLEVKLNLSMKEA